MKKLLLALLMLAVTATQAQPVSNTDKEIVFRLVNVIPMDRERVLLMQDVVVKNGVITAIGKTGTIQYSKTALIVEGKGKFLLPGLAEMHAHVPPNADIESHKEVLLLFTANGVTTIRGMLGHPSHLELRSKINKGEITGPRFLTSGPSLNGNTVKNPQQAADSVNSQQKAGYDFMKLHPGLLKQNFQAIVNTAQSLHFPFAGHVSFDVGVWRAINARYASIDHMDGFIEGLVPGVENMTETEMGLFGMYIHQQADLSRIPALIKALKDQSVWVVPTQALAERWMSPSRTTAELSQAPEMAYMSKAVLNNWISNKNNLLSNPKYNKSSIEAYIKLRRKLITDCYRNGVGLLLGSDAPQVFNVPGFSVHHELQYLVDAGLSPYEALRTGTINTGKFLGRRDIGVVAKGAVSDLLLLNANPLINIAHSRDIEGVMMRDQWFSRKFIDEILNKIKQSKNQAGAVSSN